MNKDSASNVPDFLKHLPVYRGYPVPYFVPKDENGIYQLKYASQEKMNSCLKYQKCCVCFKPLSINDYWFISGPNGLRTQTDSHPPMHRCCAEYSLQICPHLFFEKTHRTTDEQSAQPFQITQKPKEFFLVKAKRITVINYGGAKIVKYSFHEVVSGYEYVNGKLTEIANQETNL